MKYPIAIERGNDTTAWGVVVPDLPGCFSAGDTADEAYIMAKEAIEAWINTALDKGHPIPPASAMEKYVNDPAYKGWAWGLVEIDPLALDDSMERINITIPRRVLRQIDKYVKSHSGNRSSFLANSALRAVYDDRAA